MACIQQSTSSSTGSNSAEAGADGSKENQCRPENGSFRDEGKKEEKKVIILVKTAEGFQTNHILSYYVQETKSETVLKVGRVHCGSLQQ